MKHLIALCILTAIGFCAAAQSNYYSGSTAKAINITYTVKPNKFDPTMTMVRIYNPVRPLTPNNLYDITAEVGDPRGHPDDLPVIGAICMALGFDRVNQLMTEYPKGYPFSYTITYDVPTPIPAGGILAKPISISFSLNKNCLVTPQEFEAIENAIFPPGGPISSQYYLRVHRIRPDAKNVAQSQGFNMHLFYKKWGINTNDARSGKNIEDFFKNPPKKR